MKIKKKSIKSTKLKTPLKIWNISSKISLSIINTMKLSFHSKKKFINKILIKLFRKIILIIIIIIILMKIIIIIIILIVLMLLVKIIVIIILTKIIILIVLISLVKIII